MNDAQADPKQIFLDALDHASAEAREAFIAQACAGDQAVRARVEQLLFAHDQAGNFLRGDVPEPSPDIAERPGTQIGPYRLLEQIGEGGFGVVFLAEQEHPMKRKVALKIIKPGMDSRQVIARFEAERQALALMDHPNIAKVLDAGTTGEGVRFQVSGFSEDRAALPPTPDTRHPTPTFGRPYFVMELVQGIPITEYCDHCNLPMRERLQLFITVCQAVQHAHQKGIIHRDIKPTNVLVAIQDGRPAPKIIDFGVAKAINQRLTDHTLATGLVQMLGTPLYMSPEQAELSPLGVDTRSDIYSLGVLLYEVLTGATPFDKDRLHSATYDEMRRIIRDEEPPCPSARISTLAANVATTVAGQRCTDTHRLKQLVRGELDWIVMKCLEKDRNRRYDSAGGLAADIQRYLHDEPVLACPPSAAYRLQKFVRRNRASFFAASAVMIAVLVALFSLSISNARIIRERNQKDQALKEKVAALGIAQAREREARDQLFLSLLSQAKAHRRGGQMGQRVESLSALAKAARIRVDEGLRDEAIAAMALPDVRRGPAWRISIPGDVMFACDRQYQRYVRLDYHGALTVRRLADDREIQRLVPASNQRLDWLSVLRFSPDGTLLAASQIDGASYVWRLADGRSVLPDILETSCTPAFSPDCRHLAIGQNDWAICYDLTTGQESARWQLSGRAYAMAFASDSRRLAVTHVSSGVVSVYDATDGGTQLAEFSTGEYLVGHSAQQFVTWHPDGHRLAVSDGNNDIQIWDVAVGSKLAMLTGHLQQVTELAFHPDGGLLISTSWDGVVRLWDAATGRPLMQIPISLAQLQFSEDSGWLGVALDGQQIQALEIVPTRVYRTFVSSLGAGQGGYREGNFSPDGRLLAIGMDDGARLWDVITGRELARLPGPTISAFFQPSGRQLFTCGSGGLNRWKIEQRKDLPYELQLGPPRPITVPIEPHRAASSADGSVVGIVSEANGTAVTINLPAAPAADSDSVLEDLKFVHPDASFIALSRNGRWLATAGWHSTLVRLWDAHTGRMVHEWSPGKQTQVFFTPDSRALIISRGEEFSFWDVESFQRIRPIHRDVALFPGYVGFSPDGQLMALEMAPGVIHLKDAATARTVARLEDPNADRASWLGFSPDGTQLAAVAHYARAVHLWDLRAIRRQLKPMGLDWDWPEFANAESRSAGSRPSEPIWRVDVVDSPTRHEQPTNGN